MEESGWTVFAEGPAAGPIAAGWVTLAPEQPGEVPLRSWWARPRSGKLRGALVVLPEVFGVNPWVCSVADRLAGVGYGALAIPLFARTAPDLCLGYGPEALQEGRSHKDRTTAPTLLLDVARAQRWLASQASAGTALALGCVGFCFGGHVALLASSLEGMAASCVCYGAGVVQGRPGGGPPSLEVLRQPGGRVLLIYGRHDPLVPPEDLHAITKAVEKANAARGNAPSDTPVGVTIAREQATGDQQPVQLLTYAAGHGFLCEARQDFDSEAARAAWSAILTFFAESLS